MKNININDLLSINNANIIDIRNNFSYMKGHIPGAINITSQELLFNPERYLNRNRAYYIYCDSGSRSKVIVNELNNLGYNTINVFGGYNSYLFRF